MNAMFSGLTTQCTGRWRYAPLPVISNVTPSELVSPMHVNKESPDQPDVIALINELDAYQDSLYPPEARYALDLESLKKPNVVFAVARDWRGKAIGCGAVVVSGGRGELKRMYVCQEARGQGVAHAVLQVLEASAVKLGCNEVLLETGPFQAAALAFYGKHGYLRRAPFDAYPDHPLSVFMGKTLTTERTGV
jgi:putative acetyltransferase